jgi:hypothetical protein
MLPPTEFWEAAALRPLADQTKLLLLHLLTGPHTTLLPGLYRLGRLQLAESIGWDDMHKLDAAIEDLRARRELAYDWVSRVVLVPRALAHEPPANPSMVLGWAAPLLEIPLCPLSCHATGWLLTSVCEKTPAWAWAAHEVYKRVAPRFQTDHWKLTHKGVVPLVPPAARLALRDEAEDGGGHRVWDQDQNQEAETETGKRAEADAPPATQQACAEGAGKLFSPSVEKTGLLRFLQETWPSGGWTEEDVRAWRTAHPSLDLLASARKAVAYECGKEKIKYPRAFLSSWFARGQGYVDPGRPAAGPKAKAAGGGRRYPFAEESERNHAASMPKPGEPRPTPARVREILAQVGIDRPEGL